MTPIKGGGGRCALRVGGGVGGSGLPLGKVGEVAVGCDWCQFRLGLFGCRGVDEVVEFCEGFLIVLQVSSSVTHPTIKGK